MKINLLLKLSVSAVITVILSAGTVGILFYNKTVSMHVEHALKDIENKILDSSNTLQMKINRQRQDTLILVSAPLVIGLNRQIPLHGKDKSINSIDKLKGLFVEVMRNKPNYTKIRLVDKNGMEKLVVKRTEDRIYSVESDKLQNKSDRPYFGKALRTPKGEVYLSNINLNREFGVVSKPYIQVIRSAAPVYDEYTGEVSALLIVTSNIGRYLKELTSLSENIVKNETYITNDRGGYLVNPDASKNYGFDLGKQYRIQEDIPQLASLYLPDNTDRSFTLLPEGNDRENIISFSKVSFDLDDPKRFIAIGISQPYESIVTKQENVLRNIVWLSVLMVVIVAMLAVSFAYHLSKPIKQITQAIDDYSNNRNTNAFMPINQNDEIGELARSYSNMIQKVENGQKNLADLNMQLENIVTKRTLELQISDRYQRSIIDNMVDGLITSEIDGIIISFNSAAEEIFGYSASEVVGRNLTILMSDIGESVHDGYLKKYQQTGVRKIVGIGREVEGCRKDGSTFLLDLAIGEVIVDDKKVFLGVVRDITERKQVEQMKNDFVSTVSHELRTPLTAIKGSLGLVNGGAAGEIPDKAHELLLIAHNNTERLLLLINDILDIQKIESGEMDFNLRRIEIMPFLKKSIEENAAYGEQYEVDFELLEQDIDVEIYADPDRLMQVMANLLSNAAKFSPKGDKVEISVARKVDDCVRILVTDHGAGIPAEFQPKLFDRFTQSDSSSTRAKGGTGLGLNITKKIVEIQGGEIDFVSREGLGTTFIVILPLYDSKAFTEKNNVA